MSKSKKNNEPKYEKILSPSEQEVNRDILPQNVIKMGEQVLHDKNIYILQSVYKEIHDFTKDKLTVESGGMLMGYTIKANGKNNIIITGFIEGKYSEGTPTTLKFTHETWDYVHKEADEHYPNDKIIGWIHTHPNFGIFLSNYDKFIHQNFFSDENQIAYVVDPIQHTEGFFFWNNGQIEKCPGFYIYDEVGVEIDLPTVASDVPNTTPGVSTTSAMNNKSKTIIVALGIMAVLGIIGFGVLSSRISDLHQSVNALNEQLSTQNQAINGNVQNIEQSVSALEAELDKHTVVFLSDDGTLIAKNVYATGDLIVSPTEIPTKEDDEMYSYTFEGWDSEVGYVSGDKVFQAVFSSELREYTITFEDEEGNVISTATYNYGDEVYIPEYYPASIPDDGKEYEVVWDKDISTVAGDETYKAIISPVESEEETPTEEDAEDTDMSDEGNSDTTNNDE